jgi:acetyl esterase/lipase
MRVCRVEKPAHIHLEYARKALIIGGNPMREKLKVVRERERIRLVSELVFSQVPGWFGNVIRPLKLSLLTPMARSARPLPVLIWICGGAWIDMDKDVWLPELTAFAEQGYAVASVEYRLSSTAKFPAQIIDIKTSIRFLRSRADQFGLDKNRFAVMGESAGGYLAAMAGVTGRFRGFDGPEWSEESSAVQAVVDWYGPTDFVTLARETPHESSGEPASPESLLLGLRIDRNPEKVKAANPVSYLDANTPPFLILHGDRDSLVPMGQSVALYEALLKNGTDVRFYEIAGAEHATYEFVQPTVKNLILDFLNSVLQE